MRAGGERTSGILSVWNAVGRHAERLGGGAGAAGKRKEQFAPAAANFLGSVYRLASAALMQQRLYVR